MWYLETETHRKQGSSVMSWWRRDEEPSKETFFHPPGVSIPHKVHSYPHLSNPASYFLILRREEEQIRSIGVLTDFLWLWKHKLLTQFIFSKANAETGKLTLVFPFYIFLSKKSISCERHLINWKGRKTYWGTELRFKRAQKSCVGISEVTLLAIVLVWGPDHSLKRTLNYRWS